MIGWERRHNNSDIELILKPDGFIFAAIPAGCCILLETGAPDDILLESDTDGSSCIAPQDCV